MLVIGSIPSSILHGWHAIDLQIETSTTYRGEGEVNLEVEMGKKETIYCPMQQLLLSIKEPALVGPTFNAF